MKSSRSIQMTFEKGTCRVPAVSSSGLFTAVHSSVWPSG